MSSQSRSLSIDQVEALRSDLSREGFAGELRTDLPTRLLYSTDASIYQIEPLGVAFPRNPDDLAALMSVCAAQDVPVLPRGSGSSLAGQAIGRALILDCSRHLNKLVEIDPEARTATVEPGLILTALNRAAARFGLQFGPDPASAERATLGGTIANNASGAHSILYGMTADHLAAVEVVLSDGSPAYLEEKPMESIVREISPGPGISGQGNGHAVLSNLYRAALHIREDYGEEIRRRWPRTWRRASGYNLNYLLPWSASAPPQWDRRHGPDSKGSGNPNFYPPAPAGTINLASLIAGSEGTLAIIRRAVLRLSSLPANTILAVLPFPSIVAACEAAPRILEREPSAIELIPRSILQLARSVPAYAGKLAFVPGDPAAILVVEFSGDEPACLLEKAKALGEDVILAETQDLQRSIWEVRKVGLGIMQSRSGDFKPLSFIEDISVPVEHLGEFVREMERIMRDHSTEAEIYAHASAGCLHIRPILNLKTAQGVSLMRSIAGQAVALAIRLEGSVSGEHGDGLARSEWLEPLYGKEIISAFRELKTAADPKGLLNPGKIVPLDENGSLPGVDENLRYGTEYQALGWKTALDFSGQAGLAGAVEQCNGAGVCRKEGGVMCPSFQATQDEMHSTRGRANLLRAMLSGRFPNGNLAEKTVYEALDLCLACKGCKAECPSSVDVAKLKYEFSDHYYRSHRRKLRDYLFAYIGTLATLGHRFAFLVNPILSTSLAMDTIGRWIGLSGSRKLPRMEGRSLQRKVAGLKTGWRESSEKVLFLSDAFTEFFYPEAGLAALQSLERAGCQAHILPVIGAGRTLISKGFLEAARRHAMRLVEAVDRLDPQGQIPVVGVEPSEIYTLRDEYLDLLPGDARTQKLAGRAYMIDEFLVRPGPDHAPRISRLPVVKNGEERDGRSKPMVLLHGHCYQKAQPPAADGYPNGVAATVAMLKAVGYDVQVIESGCCGMAGAFGYEREHYELSMQVGELSLFPAVRNAGEETLIAAAGVSCQAQIQDGARRAAFHPVQLIDNPPAAL